MKMLNKTHVGLKELRANMEAYIERVNRGETITVFRRNTPLFKLSPVVNDEAEWETVIDFSQELGRGVPLQELLHAMESYGQDSKAA